MQTLQNDCLWRTWSDFWLGCRAQRSMLRFLSTKADSHETVIDLHKLRLRADHHLTRVKVRPSAGDVLIVGGMLSKRLQQGPSLTPTPIQEGMELKKQMIQGLLLSARLRLIFCPVSSELVLDSIAGPQEGGFSTSAFGLSHLALMRFDAQSEPCLTKKIWFYAPTGELVNLGSIPASWDFLEKRDDFAILLRTSGTKSRTSDSYFDPSQKWIAYDIRSIFMQLEAHAGYFSGAVSPKRRICHLPLYHTFGLILDFMLGIYLGDELLFCNQPQDLFRYHDQVYAFTPTILATVPKIALVLKNRRDRLRLRLDQITLHIGGARLSRCAHRAMNNLFDQIHLGYGLTECGPGVLMNDELTHAQVRVTGQEVESQEKRKARLLRLERPRMLGSQGTMGHLWVKSRTFGHWRGKKEDLLAGFLPTGDIVRTSKEGVEVLGRLDGRLKDSSGEWVYLDALAAEFEAALHLDYCKVTCDSCRIPAGSSGGSPMLYVYLQKYGEPFEEARFVKDYISKKIGIEPSSIEVIDLELSLDGRFSKEIVQ